MDDKRSTSVDAIFFLSTSHWHPPSLTESIGYMLHATCSKVLENTDARVSQLTQCKDKTTMFEHTNSDGWWLELLLASEPISPPPNRLSLWQDGSVSRKLPSLPPQGACGYRQDVEDLVVDIVCLAKTLHATAPAKKRRDHWLTVE